MAGVEKLITEHIDVWTSAIKKRNATGRGSNKKIELTGIKKLRELILELAVRGKLVPQDANDEPASVLLEKIAEEKAQLIVDKKIKKQTPLPAIEYEETFSELPEGWAHCRLNELVHLLGDGLHGTPEYSTDGDYYFVNGNNLKNGKILIKYETKKVAQDQFDKYKKTLTDNTVFVSINGTLGNVAFYNNEKIVLGKSACYFNLADCISKFFIKRLIESPRFINYAFSKASGSTIKNLGLKAMNLHVIALPPLAEQHRIVAKVDELMVLCDQLEQQTEQSLTAHQTLVEVLLASLTSDTSTDGDNKEDFQTSWQRIAEHFDVLFTTEASIEQLKQTILQLAVMGKLVPQNPNDEPASVLLEKIAKEKAQLNADKKIKKQKSLPEITDEEKPFELPKGWEWSRLGTICRKVTDGAHNPPPNTGKGYPMLSCKEVNFGKIDFSLASRFVDQAGFDKEDKRTAISAGDILLNIVASIGRSAVVPENSPKFVLQRNVAVLDSMLSPYFLTRHLISPICLDYYTEHAKGTAQQVIYLGKLSIMLLAIPPLAEQHRIVAKVDELMALCDQLKARLADAQTTQLHLADAVVENALN
jgi:type I restriction enzyme S subunit